MKRRNFMTSLAATFGGGLAASAVPRPPWRTLPRTKDGVAVRGTARNLVFILLEGAPSHVDSFDLKTGAYTPDSLGVQTFANGMKWPAGTMPQLAARTGAFSIVRSISAVEAVHERAIYHLLTAHRPNPATVTEVPHMASMLSYKLGESRTVTDSLPTVIRVGNRGPDQGFLSSDHFGLTVDASGQVALLEHPFEGEQRRLALHEGLIEQVRATQDERLHFLDFQNQAKAMMADPEIKTLFAGTEAGSFDPMASFQAQCGMAVKVLSADKGTRVIQLSMQGWDHHNNIYTDQGPFGFQNLSRAFDNGFAYLLDEMAAIPASSGSGSLLDETLIVAAGEFGRTVGNLNTSSGRDHYPYVVPALLAGGGIKPGRIIGETSAQGDYILDPGWSQNRYMGINDLVATIYSALGIDWTERILDTPSGRPFEFVDSSGLGPIFEIDSLFV